MTEGKHRMIVVLTRTALRADADPQQYQKLLARMTELVEQLPGFISEKSYTAEDGDRISMIRFDSLEALARWRNHPEHVEAQRQGKDVFYASYDVEVCEVVRAYDFRAT